MFLMFLFLIFIVCTVWFCFSLWVIMFILYWIPSFAACWSSNDLSVSQAGLAAWLLGWWLLGIMLNLFVIPQNWFRLAKKKLQHEIDQAESQLSYDRNGQIYFDKHLIWIESQISTAYWIKIIISKVYL